MTFLAGFLLGIIVGVIVLIDICCYTVSGKESKDEPSNHNGKID